MKIAVTSASGKLGTAVINQLIADIGKENTIGIARTPANAEHLGVEIRKGDYNHQAEFDVALKGVDTLLLISGMDDPQKRIVQHRNLIAAAKKCGVKKIVYTSIIGAEDSNAFSPIVQTNRQTEEDVRNSSLDWVIGRNGIYIEPDLEYIDTYKNDGEIRNCAGAGKCTYTSRQELGYAYSKLLRDDKHNGQTYNLVGEGITQAELAHLINQEYDTDLVYNSVSFEEYAQERKAALGEFMGTVIAGIYQGIAEGANEVPSDYQKAAGRPHLTPVEMIKKIKTQKQSTK